MRIFIAVLYVFCLSLAGFGQKTTISGTAPGAELKNISITTPGDLMTFWEKPLVLSKVDSTAHFAMEVTLAETIFATISINFHKAELFLEPGKSYDLQIEPMRYDDYTEVNPFIQSQKLNFEIAGAGPEELNTLIGTFNGVYSGFLMEHFNALYRDRNKTVLDTFRIKLNEQFGEFREPYFTNYAKYKFASLEQLTKYHSQALLARKYFNEPPVLYNNLEYMEFFNSFFAKYLTASSNILRKIQWRPLLTDPTPYTSMMKAITTDTVVKQDQVRELVLLKGLMEFYNSASFKQEEVISAIKDVADNAKFPENKVVATNMLSMFSRLKPGTPAPDFTLTNRDQKPLSLKNLRGKPVVLNFWTTYCEGCLAEMDLIKPLVDKYGSQYQFVSVSADKYFSKMLYFINQKKDYTWTFLNTGDHSEVLKDYDVRSYPLFVIIDKDGNIAKYPADIPSKGLEGNLQKLLEK